MAEEEQATLETKNEQPPATEDKQESTGPKNIVAIEQAGPCKKKVTVEIPQQAIKNATDKQYDTLRKEALVPGFRKGRAPRRLLEKRFGKETAEQIKLKLLIEASDSAIKDNKLDILGEPTIDHEKVELPEAGPLKFDFQVDVRPVITLPPLESIPVTRAKLEVTDEQVDREIEQCEGSRAYGRRGKTGDIQLDDQIIADVVLKAAEPRKKSSLIISKYMSGTTALSQPSRWRNLTRFSWAPGRKTSEKPAVEVPRKHISESNIAAKRSMSALP